MNNTIFQELPKKMNLISDLFSRVVFSDREACQEKGQKFRELPDIYHIFITMSDFIGGGRTIYEVFRTVREADGQINTQYPMDNGVHEIYINLEIPLGDDSELEHLLRYIKETTTENEDSRFPHIISSVNACRKEGAHMKYYNSQEFFEEGKKEIIRKMLSMNQPLEFISQCTDKPVSYIQQIAQEEPMIVRENSDYHVSEE